MKVASISDCKANSLHAVLMSHAVLHYCLECRTILQCAWKDGKNTVIIKKFINGFHVHSWSHDKAGLSS